MTYGKRAGRVVFDKCHPLFYVALSRGSTKSKTAITIIEGMLSQVINWDVKNWRVVFTINIMKGYANDRQRIPIAIPRSCR